MPRKPVGFRLEAELVARMEAAVEAGLAANKTELVERALEKALGDGPASVGDRCERDGRGKLRVVDGRLECDFCGREPRSGRESPPPAESVPEVFESGTQWSVTVVDQPRPWRQHLPTCRCAVCKPPRAA